MKLILKKFTLQENILCEDIDSMKKYYPGILDNEFIEYLRLDPTYKEGSNNAGKYGKWILELVKRGTFSRKNHIKDLLMRFEQEKKNLINKDIMKYKSVEELEAALDDDNSYSELSNRQKERRIRSSDNLVNDAEKVYEDNKWEIWIPKTWEASCTLGKGTKWCTAYSGSSDYYDMYSKEGDLYIVINKTDKSEKYQFHFQSEQYMDKDDKEIDLFGFLYKNHGIYEFFENHINIYPLKYFEELYKNGVYYYGNFEVLPDLSYYGIADVIITDGITTIDDRAFFDCTGLMRITIPDTITSIGWDAFYGCTNLEEVIIPNSVTSIGDFAFYGCTSLRSITIPNGVTSIGQSTFASCDSLQSVIIPDSVTRICSFAFNGCRELKDIYYAGSPGNWKAISIGRENEQLDKATITFNSRVALAAYKK